ncbi:GTPase/DUF3482 domain-containing protein [Pelomonas sp. KK5]|uniref:GTPase/DUF3482 domain-containing protein n=1 Tax=Pelomonas sp. KK5 TaxID=1855730 RepID=UPI00097BE049|nr:GTPase/DUF3482 domain-containing protein [Pelomonas sp. KK5]
MTPLAIAVVGHTNAGKTSLLRTLTRRRDFGRVSEQPGTTRHVEAITLSLDGTPPLRFFDTPGLEDSIALWQHLQQQGGDDRPARVRAFLAGPEARATFEQEAKVLRRLLEVDAGFYVIDCREPVLPKHRAEIELLNSCARPLMPVLNFVADPAARTADWQQALAGAGLHAQTAFDAVAPFIGAERQLYQDLATLLPARRAELQQVNAALDEERHRRAEADARAVADLLVQLAALRREIDRRVHADARARAEAERQLQLQAVQRVRRCADLLMDIHGFDRADLQLSRLPWQDGRWASDLFHPDTLREAGRKLGMGAAVGASLGVVADLAVGGLSLGAGAALGGAIGTVASQGWRQIGRKLANRLSGVHELTLADPVIFLAGRQLCDLAGTLEQRGHAALGALVQAEPSMNAGDDKTLRETIALAQTARSHPDWAEPGKSQRRELLVEDISRQLQRIAPR